MIDDLLRAFAELDISPDEADDLIAIRNDDKCPSSHLHDWLYSGSGIFWIWGKPGCGKSTLMKAVLQNAMMHKKLQELLSAWSDGKNLITAKFFFVRPGMSLQKSHNGFLRSLLYQILSKRPAIVDKIWSAKDQRNIVYRASTCHNEDELWSTEELKRAFRTWRQYDESKLYLHVDGIDEVDATFLDIANILTEVVTDRSDVKMLASGRWAPEFDEAFSNVLVLHDITKLDILQFTVYRLKQSTILDILDDIADQFLWIVKDIITAAQGVFQWVKIVIESLLHGVRRFENFDQLSERLNEYPRELDRLYWFLYTHIEEVHLADSAFWLLTLKAASQVESIQSTAPSYCQQGLSNLSRPKLWRMSLMESYDSNEVSWLLNACDWIANNDKSKPAERAKLKILQSECPSCV